MAGRAQMASMLAVLLLANIAWALSAEEVRTTSAALAREGERLSQEKASLDAEYDGLEALAVALEQKSESLKSKSAALKREKGALVMQKGQIEQKISNYNSYCRGEFLGDEYRRRKQWCDANFHPLNSLRKQWARNQKVHNEKVTNLKQDYTRLSKDTLAWAGKVKDTVGRVGDWQARQRDWLNRVRNFSSSPALNDLKRKSGAAADCSGIPGIGEFTPDLDGPSERAHRCLQKIWDGAQ